MILHQALIVHEVVHDKKLLNFQCRELVRSLLAVVITSGFSFIVLSQSIVITFSSLVVILHCQVYVPPNITPVSSSSGTLNPPTRVSTTFTTKSLTSSGLHANVLINGFSNVSRIPETSIVPTSSF